MALRTSVRDDATVRLPTRLIVFVGLRIDDGRRALTHAPVSRHAADEQGIGECTAIFPASVERETRQRIEAELNKEIETDRNLVAMAGGTAGGDLLFHELCREKGIQAQMFLALPKPQHVGE